MARRRAAPACVCVACAARGKQGESVRARARSRPCCALVSTRLRGAQTWPARVPKCTLELCACGACVCGVAVARETKEERVQRAERAQREAAHGRVLVAAVLEQLVDREQRELGRGRGVVRDVQVEHLFEHDVVGREVGGARHHGKQRAHVHARRHVVDDLAERVLLGRAQLVLAALARRAQRLQLRAELGELACGVWVVVRCVLE